MSKQVLSIWCLLCLGCPSTPLPLSPEQAQLRCYLPWKQFGGESGTMSWAIKTFLQSTKCWKVTVLVGRSARKSCLSHYTLIHRDSILVAWSSESDTKRKDHAEPIPLCSFLASGLPHKDYQMAKWPKEEQPQVAWKIKVRKHGRKSVSSGTRKTEFWPQYLWTSVYYFIVKELDSVQGLHTVLHTALGVPDVFQEPPQRTRRGREGMNEIPQEHLHACQILCSV